MKPIFLIVNTGKSQNNPHIKSKAPLSPPMRATALLLVNRDLLSHMPELNDLELLDMLGCKLFCAMAAILAQNPQATDDEIQQLLPADLANKFVPSELRAIARTVPIDAIQDEFLGIIALLRRHEKELIMDKLLLKAKQNALTDADKQLLQQMLQEKGKV